MYKGERFNSYTHLTGLNLSAAGFIFLLYLAFTKGDVWKITSFAIYGFTLDDALHIFHTVPQCSGETQKDFSKT